MVALAQGMSSTWLNRCLENEKHSSTEHSLWNNPVPTSKRNTLQTQFFIEEWKTIIMRQMPWSVNCCFRCMLTSCNTKTKIFSWGVLFVNTFILTLILVYNRLVPLMDIMFLNHACFQLSFSIMQLLLPFFFFFTDFRFSRTAKFSFWLSWNAMWSIL